MQLFLNIIVSLALLTQLVFALEITENKIDRGTVTLNLGDITIYPGASWSIIDNAYTNFVGKLDVRAGAGLYISLTSHLLALQVSLTTLLHSITNNGVVSFDSRVSRTSSSYDLRGVSFTNNGEMYFAASGEFSSSTALTSALWTNTGLLLFYQNQRTSGTVSLGLPLGSITNNGQICLNNQVYEQTTQIKGSGCFTAKGDSTIYISNVLLAVSPKQNFYLTDKGSSMIVQAVSTTQTFNVYGFGEGNKIGLTIPLMGNLWNSAYAYDTVSGILTLRNLLLEQKFNIGTGYDPSKFQVVTDSGSGIPSTIMGSVAYYGRIPERALPKSCQTPCKPVPEAPGTTPTQYTTTISKTNTAGNTVTESGVVNVLTDKGGSWFTTTSMFPALPSDTILSTVELSTTQLSSSADIPVETSSAEELLTDTASWETSAAPILPTETPVSSHHSSVQHSSTIGESSADVKATHSSEFGFETASDYIVIEPSTSEHSATLSQSSVAGETHSSKLVASDEPSFVTPSESFIFSASASSQPSVSSDSITLTTQSETTSSAGQAFVTLAESDTESISSKVNTLASVTKSSDIQTEFTSTWTTANSDGCIVTESGIISQSGTSLTTLTTFQPATSLSVPPTSVIETEFTTTWTTAKPDSSVATESGVVSQSETLLTTLTTFPAPSSDIVLGSTLTWESDISNEPSDTLTVSASSYELVNESLAATTTTSFSSSTIVVAPSESDISTSSSVLNNGKTDSVSVSVPNSNTSSIAQHSNGPLSMITTELVNNNPLAPESTNLIVTATITNCNKSKCSESVVTYITSVPHTTVTTGESKKDISTAGNNVSSILGEDVSNTGTITMAASTDGTTPLVGMSGLKPSVVNNDTNSVHATATTAGAGAENDANLPTASDIPVEISVIRPTNSSSSAAVTIPYENGSNKEPIENIKYLALVVFGLMMFM